VPRDLAVNVTSYNGVDPVGQVSRYERLHAGAHHQYMGKRFSGPFDRSIPGQGTSRILDE
jgi:hypothetical protein